uniref:Serpin domain-containing protein n=1 Tax=Aegilops tauschii subsp. strangulata TaxID=200361 RepID=A0A453HEU5_AEGTS
AATGTRLSIAHQTRFALRVASAISSPSNADGAAGNAAFSLLSLHIALSLIAADAGGATRGQLAATLGAEGTGEAESLHALAQHVVQLVLADASAKGGPRVAFANGLFVDTSMPLKSSFKEVAVGKYKAETHSVDFQTKVMCMCPMLLITQSFCSASDSVVQYRFFCYVILFYSRDALCKCCSCCFYFGETTTKLCNI